MKHVNWIKVYLGFYIKQSLVAIALLLLIFLLAIPQMTSAQQKFGPKEDLLSVCFATEQEGWACGRWGTILHTKDGGLSWVSQNSGVEHTLMSVKFVDPQNGWAVGDGGTIIRTGDGGKTWVKQKSPVNFFLMGAHFSDVQTGWIVTEWSNILFTKDGGKTWQIQFKDGDHVLKAVSFCDAKNGWVVGEYGYIYRTTDGGINWKRQAGSFYLSNETFELIAGNFLFDVIAIDPMTAWAVGIGGYVIKTIDGGVSWKVITGFPKMHLFGISGNSHGTFVIGGKGALFSSQDGGKSFKVCRVEPPIIYDWIYKIASRGSKGFVAVGNEGKNYLAGKNGDSWRQAENVNR